MRVSPEEAAFWDAICSNPDDPTPRLIFADWCEERYGGGKDLRIPGGDFLVNGSGCAYYYVSPEHFNLIGTTWYVRSMRCRECKAEHFLRWETGKGWICYYCWKKDKPMGIQLEGPRFLFGNP